jgi:hypothetical protein
MRVSVGVVVHMAVSLVVGMRMAMRMRGFVRLDLLMMVMVFGVQVNVELGSGDAAFMGARGVDMITIHSQFRQLVLQFFEVEAEIEQRPEKHVSADPAEQVEVKGLHDELKPGLPPAR